MAVTVSYRLAREDFNELIRVRDDLLNTRILKGKAAARLDKIIRSVGAVHGKEEEE